MIEMPPPQRRAVAAWAMYDWANSVFSVTVISAFFPLFLKQYWSSGVDATISTFQLGLANAAAAWSSPSSPRCSARSPIRAARASASWRSSPCWPSS
jgi:hypothetical protein